MHDLLIPIDEIIRDLQIKITDLEWEYEDSGALQRQLDHYMKERDKGVIYEPMF